jgi:O-acetyl-ADP-ribose deacetylase (regulator of RNase III)
MMNLNEDNMRYVNAELKKESSWFEYRKGNILSETDLDYIIHQANCFNCMGGGVALALAKQWPVVAAVDNKTEYGDKNKLGNFTFAKVSHSIRVGDEIVQKPVTVINMYSQFYPGKCGPYEFQFKRLEAMKAGLDKIKDFILNNLLEDVIVNKVAYVGIPWLIGCGISGLDENDVFEIIKNTFESFSEHIKIVFVDFN